MAKKKIIKVIKTPEEFANMSSSEIVRVMESNRAFAITNNDEGRRYIIERAKGTY